MIKTQVIPGYSDHDAVFVEGNIKVTINKQICGMVPLLLYTVEKQTGMP